MHGFEPVEGELTLRAFLDYVDAVEALEKEEWEPVQPSDDDAVKVMTIHQAKGLEFDHVFVPGVASGLMPSKRIQQNPAERGYSLDFELRGDAAILPTFDGVLSHFKRDLQAQEVIEERRTMYVALTRARRTRCGSAPRTGTARTCNAKGPSEFFAELADVGQDTRGGRGRSSPRRLPPTTTSPASRAEPDARLPRGARARLARSRAPRRRRRAVPGRVAASRGRAARRGRRAGRAASTTLDGDDREAFERAAAEQRQLAPTCASARPARAGRSAERAPRRPWAPASSSPTPNAPSASTGPRVRPLPRFSGPAARIGTEIHAWIERRARGQGQLLEIDDRPDLTDEELAGDPGRVERLREAFLAQPVRRRDAAVRRASVPAAARRVHRGRAHRRDLRRRRRPVGDRRLEDRAKRPPAEDPTLGLQLDIYGLAAVEIWGKAPADVTLTYFYLASGDEVTKPMDDPAVVRDRVRGVAGRDRRPARSTRRPARGAPTATSDRSATPARPGSPRTRP